METWTQPITAPRQPDFGGDLSPEEEEWQAGEPPPRQEVAEYPPLSRPIEVGPTHETGIEILTVATVLVFLLVVMVLLPLLVLTAL